MTIHYSTYNYKSINYSNIICYLDIYYLSALLREQKSLARVIHDLERVLRYGFKSQLCHGVVYQPTFHNKLLLLVCVYAYVSMFISMCIWANKR